MIDKEKWMSGIIEKLKKRFGSRLLFVGLQGSYQRGEANEASDFDVVVVFDELSVADLQEYRMIISTMPESGKACGFVCGSEELRRWPKYELFQLERDTETYFGDLAPLLPPFGGEDIRQSVQNAAAGLYHAACHQFLFGAADNRYQDLQSLYKSVFFILRLTGYLRTGHYCGTKAELLECLEGEERVLLETAVRWDEYADGARPCAEACFERLITWCQNTLRRYGCDDR